MTCRGSAGFEPRPASNSLDAALAVPSSISLLASDAPQTLEQFHCLGAPERFQRHFGLEVTTKILTLAFL